MHPLHPPQLSRMFSMHGSIWLRHHEAQDLSACREIGSSVLPTSAAPAPSVPAHSEQPLQPSTNHSRHGSTWSAHHDRQTVPGGADGAGTRGGRGTTVAALVEPPLHSGQPLQPSANHSRHGSTWLAHHASQTVPKGGFGEGGTGGIKLHFLQPPHEPERWSVHASARSIHHISHTSA